MKQRFSSLDVKVIAHELQQSLVSLRLSNVYDLSSKILLFKFAKPENKKQLIIDTGFRCHLTDFARTTAAAPSVFVAKLRKCLKTRRVTSVSQVGTDRILEFGFSDGQFRLFLEFFASGNIILTDADLKIIAISRTVSEAEGQEPQRVGLSYSLDNRQNYQGVPPLIKERVEAALRAGIERTAASASSSKKIKVKAGADLRRTLAVSITELPPVLVENTLQDAGFDTTLGLEKILGDEALVDRLVELLTKARSVVEDILSSEQCVGYIFAKRRNATDSPPQGDDIDEQREQLLYEDFHPFVPRKFADDATFKVIEFKGYNAMVDEFFSSLEGQKLESKLNERQAAAQRKLDAAKQDQAKRIEGLQETQTLNLRKAAAIEASPEWVQEAMDAVNGLLAQGMDWVDIGKLIDRERKRNNPVAQMIKTPLKLSENVITLLLAEEDEDEDAGIEAYETDEEEESDDDVTSGQQKEKTAFKGLEIDVNLSMTPWSNAREYYGQRRVAVVKEEKTQQQAARALKNTEMKIAEDLKKGLKQEKALLQPIRKQMWYEKFIWFISSDNYLVLGGKDSQQNEMLYRRYLRKGDVYCHAELHGAASVVIKNNPATPDAPIPPATLTQAGSLSVCSSSAWDSKAGMSAWWVHADQVSKSAPTGEFLPTGSFMVRGKKNFLPPAQLLLGLGLIFRISEESKAKHVKHRLHDVASGEPTSTSADKGDPSLGVEKGAEVISEDDGDDVEESESDNEENETTSRANPLQTAAGDDEHDDDDAEESGPDVRGQMSQLSVSDSAAVSKRESQEATTPLKAGEGADEASDEEEELSTFAASEAPTKVSNGAESQATGASTKGPAPAKRGQKKKAKKIARKYKDQDDEDRAAAEAIIGAKAGQKRAEDEAKAKADKEAELAAAKERRRAQHQRQQKEAAEHEEIRRVMMDEGVDLLDSEEAEQVTALDALVGTPLPGDEILEIIPVCAPWNALVKTKYKVKLQPGAMKKGKAVKEVLERWKAAPTKKGVVDEAARDAERMWPREVELIKGLKPEEIINSVPVGKVRVMTTGGTAGGGGGGGKGGGKGVGKGGKGGKGSKR